MTESNGENIGSCCKDKNPQIKYALMALDKMKDMFGVGLGTLADPSCKPTNVPCGCVVDSKCRMPTCPYRNVPPYVSTIILVF